MAVMLAACGTGGKVSASADAQNGKTLFQQKCAGCHALEAVGSTSTIGPNLDDAFAQARSEGFDESAIANIVHDQIRFPGQYATGQNNPNYLTANMPAKLVTGRDADDVAAFVAANAGVSGFAVTQTVSGTVPHHYDRTDDLLKEMSDARVWGGMHLRISTEDGAQLGKNVAKWIVKHHFRPIRRSPRQNE